MQLTVRRAAGLHGVVSAPPDKSIAHRAAVLNALADEPAEIEDYLDGHDTRLTLQALRQVGVGVSRGGERVVVTGRGGAPFEEPDQPLYVGRSATTMRFMAGLLAASPLSVVLTGTRRTNVRPMARVADPLREMGAHVSGRAGDRAPLLLRGGPIRGIRHRFGVPTAEAKTAVIVAALQASGETVLSFPRPSRDHTERMLRAMGANVETSDATIRVEPVTRPLRPLSMRVPGEISVAVYWLVAASVHPDADVTVRNVCVNPSRTGLLDVLTRMGARIDVLNERSWGVEPVADIRVRSSQLDGVEVGPDDVPRMIDEFPGFVLAAALAKGTTRIREADELRRKKSDRIAMVAQEYRRLGARIEEAPGGMTITGVERLHGARCRAHGDHRLASSLAFAGLVADGGTVVDGAELIERVSYPGFGRDLERVRED